jgi:tyrosyl-tRNA synthetase
MSIPDETIAVYFRLLTAHHADELEEIERALTASEVKPRDLKARLAREIIARLRGTEAAAEAEEHFERVFRRHEAAVDLHPLEILAEDEENGSVYLPRVLERWFGVTRSDARRRIDQGGVSLDGKTVVSLTLPAEELRGRHIKAGKSAKFQGIIGAG